MDQQSSALKVEEETELLQELAQSDMESSMPASQFQSMRWPALAVVCSLAAVGVVSMMGSKGIAVADVAATVDLHSSWDHWIDVTTHLCKGQCDAASLIGLEDSGMWNSQSHPKALKMTRDETQMITMNLKKGESSWATTGIMVGGKKYHYMKECGGITTFKKKDQGVISMAKSDTAVVVVHSPDDADSRLSNLAVHAVASELSDSGMRRLMRGGGATGYARRLQHDDAASVVVDMDSNMIRAGLAGEDSPAVTEPPEADDFKSRMEQVYDKLEVDASEQVVLISETPLTPPESLQEWTGTLFEDLKVPGMALANAAALAAMAQGKSTAVVLYIADDAFYAVPVYELVPLDYATIRESKEDNSADKFAETVYNSIMKTDVDIRKDLYANVVISGDSTSADSLKEKLAEFAPPTVKINVVGVDEETKGLLPWIGGSISASLSTFRFITDSMYNEQGPDVVLNTCF